MTDEAELSEAEPETAEQEGPPEDVAPTTLQMSTPSREPGHGGYGIPPKWGV
jgi:hypothetical protein